MLAIGVEFDGRGFGKGGGGDKKNGTLTAQSIPFEDDDDKNDFL